MTEIKNPNQSGGGGGDSRTLLIFSVLFLLMFLGIRYFGPKNPPPPAKQTATTTAPATTPAGSGAASPATPESASTATSAPAATKAKTRAVTPVSKAAAQPVVAQQASTTVVENELYRITFSNQGADATSWILKKYKDDHGKPLDLANHDAGEKFGYPLSIWTPDAKLRARLAKALFVPSAQGTLAVPGTLTYTYSEGGLHVQKAFTFGSNYVIHAKVTATDNGKPLPAYLAWPAGFGDQMTRSEYSQSWIDTSIASKADHQADKKVSDGATRTETYDWAGASDLYFAATFLPDLHQPRTLVSLHNTLEVPKDPNEPKGEKFSASIVGAALGGEGGGSMRLFVGPKVIDVLKAVRATAPDGSHTGPSLEPVLNFGFWGFIAKPLFLALRWVYDSIVPNWGWAILVLTLLITLAMLPTRIKMMRSALKMQRIQPEMNAIKEKYKKYKASDPRRAEMNKEIFELQKREGVNMFGGCLPMLIQYPLLYGFYKMLEIVIELRQAHWFWLDNLAAPDPTHILPIFFIVTMFLVQYLTPSPGMDKKQQRMMAYTMPIFFGWMTWNLGSGLTLYWAFSNVINVIQQAFMNRTAMGKQMREIAARRAAKKSGHRQMARK